MKNFIALFFLFIVSGLNATGNEVFYWDSCSTTIEIKIIESSSTEIERPFPILKLLKEKQFNKRKLTAALLAFPFPFGIVGLHRIYLGTKPYVPVVYIATLGGIFGVIPLIDFFVILFDKNTDNYSQNGKVLMWVK